MTIFEIEYSNGVKIEWLPEYVGMLSDNEIFQNAVEFAIANTPKYGQLIRVECIAC